MAIGLVYILWYRGVKEIGNSRSAAYPNPTPVVVMVVAWFWLVQRRDPTYSSVPGPNSPRWRTSGNS
jgi:drug/metabolite transporter (DMT)-like permease